MKIEVSWLQVPLVLAVPFLAALAVDGNISMGTTVGILLTGYLTQTVMQHNANNLGL